MQHDVADPVGGGLEYIAVETPDWERACALLREAIEDGAISEEDGELIDE